MDMFGFKIIQHLIPKEMIINAVDLTGQFSAEISDKIMPDSPRYITMTVENKPFSLVFNSILMSSGLEAKLENELYI